MTDYSDGERTPEQRGLSAPTDTAILDWLEAHKDFRWKRWGVEVERVEGRSVANLDYYTNYEPQADGVFTAPTLREAAAKAMEAERE